MYSFFDLPSVCYIQYTCYIIFSDLPITEYNNKENKNSSNNNKNECIRLHYYIHVRHIKQPQSIFLKFFMLFLNSQTDLLDFM